MKLKQAALLLALFSTQILANNNTLYGSTIASIKNDLVKADVLVQRENSSKLDVNPESSCLYISDKKVLECNGIVIKKGLLAEDVLHAFVFSKLLKYDGMAMGGKAIYITNAETCRFDTYTNGVQTFSCQ